MKLLFAMKHRMIGLFCIFLPVALMGAMVPTRSAVDTLESSVSPQKVDTIISQPVATPEPVRDSVSPQKSLAHEDAA